MRTNVPDELRALRRPAALAALAAAVGGLVGCLTPRLPLWALLAEVQALDTIETSRVTTLAGADTSAVVWVAVAAGVAVTALGLLLALDRPVAGTERLLLVGALVLLGTAAVVLARPPAVAAFGTDPRAAELIGAPSLLMTGVSIELGVQPAVGVWMLVAAAVAVLGGGWAASRHG